MAQDSHPIRNAVIAGLILAGILWAVSYVPLLWEPLKVAGVAVWAAVTAVTYRIGVPAWLLALLVLGTLAWATPLVKRLQTEPAPTWRDYVTDYFDGMRWRWAYDSGGEVDNPLPHCPDDDTRLVGLVGPYAAAPSYVLRCESCGKQWGPFQGDGYTHQARVERQIDRKVRSGEWESVVGGTAPVKS